MFLHPALAREGNYCHVCSCTACMGESQTFNSNHWSHLGERVWLANQKRSCMGKRNNPQ